MVEESLPEHLAFGLYALPLRTPTPRTYLFENLRSYLRCRDHQRRTPLRLRRMHSTLWLQSMGSPAHTLLLVTLVVAMAARSVVVVQVVEILQRWEETRVALSATTVSNRWHNTVSPLLPPADIMVADLKL